MMIVDREGRVRQIAFGTVDELALGTYLGRLLAEQAPRTAPSIPVGKERTGESCDVDGSCT